MKGFSGLENTALAVGILLVLASLSGCQAFHQKPNVASPNLFLPYSPEDKEQFVFSEQAEWVQRNGYSDFCLTTEVIYCPEKLPYKEHVGKRGYFLSKFPTVNKRGYEFHPVMLETGERLYFVFNKKFGGKFGKHSPIIPLGKSIELKTFNVRPLIAGSDIHIVGMEVDSGKDLLVLSNGKKITNEHLSMIYDVCERFNNNPELAALLIDKRIKKDEVDLKYFIQPSDPLKDNGIKFYIGFDDKSEWLRLKIQYHGNDWLFVKSFKIAADDFRWQSPVYEFGRDNAGGDVWEWLDIEPAGEEVSAAIKLANADRSILRFQGMNYNFDKTLSGVEKIGISEMISLFLLMKAPERGSEKTALESY